MECMLHDDGPDLRIHQCRSSVLIPVMKQLELQQAHLGIWTQPQVDFGLHLPRGNLFAEGRSALDAAFEAAAARLALIALYACCVSPNLPIRTPDRNRNQRFFFTLTLRSLHATQPRRLFLWRRICRIAPTSTVCATRTGRVLPGFRMLLMNMGDSG